MAVTVVEETRTITGGVDTHADVHVAAALDPIGACLASLWGFIHWCAFRSSRCVIPGLAAG
jgi:hypothetical protein